MKTIKLTAEQAQQIEEASARVEQSAEECMGDDGMVMVVPLDLYNELVESLEAIRASRAQVQAEQEPVAWYDKIKGMEVSMDVSTGEDDDYYRIFGRVDGVMLQSCGAQEDTILVIEDSRNFAAPVRTKDLTAQEKANIIYAADHRNPMAMIDAAIALYREKNK